MRRLLLPIALLAVAIGAVIQMNRANEDADPGRAVEVSSDADLSTPIFSARRAPEWLRNPQSDTQLTAAINGVLRTGATPPLSCVVVERNGEQLAASNIKAPIRTDELHRLITATVIDAEAGSGAPLRTEIAISIDAEIVVIDEETGASEIVGDIWLIGAGDPGLATRAYADRFENGRLFTDFDQLAADVIAELQRRNIVEIDGRIIGDETKYTPVELDYFNSVEEFTDEEGNTLRFDVWNRSDTDNDIGPLSALLLNDGFESWPEEQDGFDQSQNVRSTNPAVFAAAYFDDQLEAAGIIVRRSAQAGEAPATAERETLAVIDSPTLDEIIQTSLIDATTAEMLLKEYGVRSGVDSERVNAVAALRTGGFTGAGLPFNVLEPSLVYVDGSGRSELNRASCEIIHATIAQPDGVGASVLSPIESSPLAACAAGPGEMRVMATASGTATGLTGWYDAPNGERLTFTMLAEDATRLDPPEDDPEGEPVGPFEQCNTLQAALIDAIAGHPYGPDLGDLAPLDPAG
ncbi:MAG: D-alanyl-D-alanine carboxypeptidase [Actinomycetota bacterium]